MSEIIAKLEKHIADECTAIDCEKRFDEMLDECQEPLTVGHCTVEPSRFLKEFDPVAYRCGCSDYFSDSDFVEVDGEIYDSSEADKAKEEFIEGYEDKLTDAEDEFESMDEEQNEAGEICALQAEIASLKAIIYELNQHSF